MATEGRVNLIKPVTLCPALVSPWVYRAAEGSHHRFVRRDSFYCRGSAHWGRILPSRPLERSWSKRVGLPLGNVDSILDDPAVTMG